MNAQQQIEKIFGSDYMENRFQSKFEKSQFTSTNFVNNSKKNIDNQLIKPKKFIVNSFKKQFTNIENKNTKKDKKKTNGYIGNNINSEFLKNVNENNKDNNNIEEIINDLNKMKNKKKIINPYIKESRSSKNIINFKNINKNTEEKKLNVNSSLNDKNNSKSKKKKETLLNKIHNINYTNNQLKIGENKNKGNNIQTAIQLEIKSKKDKYKDYKIEKIQIPNFF